MCFSQPKIEKAKPIPAPPDEPTPAAEEVVPQDSPTNSERARKGKSSLIIPLKTSVGLGKTGLQLPK